MRPCHGMLATRRLRSEPNFNMSAAHSHLTGVWPRVRRRGESLVDEHGHLEAPHQSRQAGEELQLLVGRGWGWVGGLC